MSKPVIRLNHQGPLKICLKSLKEIFNIKDLSKTYCTIIDLTISEDSLVQTPYIFAKAMKI